MFERLSEILFDSGEIQPIIMGTVLPKNIALNNIQKTTHLPSMGSKYLKDIPMLSDEKHLRIKRYVRGRLHSYIKGNNYLGKDIWIGSIGTNSAEILTFRRIERPTVNNK